MADAIDDLQLASFLQLTVQGITNLPGELVRPRWQPVPPTQPPASVNWVAVGVLERIGFDYPFQWLEPSAPFDMNARYVQVRQERLEVLCSFYGPNSGALATLLRDGLYVAQNRELLNSRQIRVTGVGTARSVPELVAEAWLNRVDLPLTFAREVKRGYRVLSLLSAEIQFVEESGLVETVIIDQGVPPSW